ncbi:hypothetical protein FHQ18_01830 [Deferribacter autotrophicus]|uniref:Uncharacterized protein n=1 Tax=Deferribacter autotrophicus TaxID=500465 RepID=A0A5A8F8T2_9BACT|nr:hypothetical protein [Deferribacter autotrophicus]KAA0259216.1 hypothetical protein FHQ18_01830 [Deferribacter autotrophicus]
MKIAMIAASLYTITFCLLILFENNKFCNLILDKIKLVYLGFSTKNLKGIFVGIIWAFFDGFLTGWIIYYLINIFD